MNKKLEKNIDMESIEPIIPYFKKYKHNWYKEKITKENKSYRQIYHESSSRAEKKYYEKNKELIKQKQQQYYLNRKIKKTKQRTDILFNSVAWFNQVYEKFYTICEGQWGQIMSVVIEQKYILLPKYKEIIQAKQKLKELLC